MEQLEKLSILAGAARYEAAEARRGNHPPSPRPCGLSQSQLQSRYGDYQRGVSVRIDGKTIPLHMAVVPGGRRVPLLKAMISTACERDCNYCAMRAGSDMRRVSFNPDEMARTYHIANRTGIVQGLFLSNGIVAGGPATQDLILATAEILRNRYNYRGYLHLKIMPGAERDQILRTMQLADRVSVNLEAPNEFSLSVLAPSKRFNAELVDPLKWIERIRQTRPASEAWNGRWPSSTTQFVVGAAHESDLDLLNTVQHLQRQTRISRAYFEAFDPKEGTPFENLPPENPMREHRLYQASFLIRDYGYELEELHLDPDGNLPLNLDPKVAIAEQTLAGAPIEVNTAEPEDLVRIPGIGVQTARNIVLSRKQRRLVELGQLRRVGAIAERAAPYITLDGKSPISQLSLFE